jgi:hypothetical protein
MALMQEVRRWVGQRVWAANDVESLPAGSDKRRVRAVLGACERLRRA